MFYIRKQFRRSIIEQTFVSESQAVARAYEAWSNGGYTSVQVFNTAGDVCILDLGHTESEAINLAWSNYNAKTL